MSGVDKNIIERLRQQQDIVRGSQFNKTFLFKRRPKGFFIFDSFNSSIIPIVDIQIDRTDFDFIKLRKYFHKNYTGSLRDIYLPWHYTIDSVFGTPTVINCRPFNYRSGLPGYSEYITIMLIGDSTIDYYTPQYYKTIANLIINPFLQIATLSPIGVSSGVSKKRDDIGIVLDLPKESNFKIEYLEKEIVYGN